MRPKSGGGVRTGGEDAVAIGGKDSIVDSVCMTLDNSIRSLPPVLFPRSTWECPPERSAFTRRRASWKLIPRGAWNEGGRLEVQF
ncbi:hypothetical protein MNBD_CHLOROFLEXI01-2260 [hydrothermal vent metagenome]|uniref:Uncharacterized protein n=1 Tax=hydrothermal vent metagenome TaxID=652676 RepID=A0A3B0VT66_9ZZZZ